ncbi:MAG TPA: potassium channel family protein [Actinomycetota bacterium]|nr:potassium channel family protein [Actinomycetota bacterium]
MKILLGALGVALVLVVFWDAFETLILPRRVSRRFRIARAFYRTTWSLWTLGARVPRTTPRRETYLSYYGPLSLLFLLAVWGGGLILGFALMIEGVGRVHAAGAHTFLSLVYLSASTFFTLGLGDITPANRLGRLVTVAEAGAGLAFLALVISYLPVLYQSFSRREVRISLLDERAGSPPSAGELLGRRGPVYAESGLQFLREWELWCAELLESHLSYPVLAYFRSQHDNQSWLSALTVILDACALVMAGMAEITDSQARLTFAMARHAAVDLAAILGTPPVRGGVDRLPPEGLDRLRRHISESGLTPAAGERAGEELRSLRATYEPYLRALSAHLRMPLPAWMPAEEASDNWEVTAWEGRPARRWMRRGPSPRQH